MEGKVKVLGGCEFTPEYGWLVSGTKEDWYEVRDAICRFMAREYPDTTREMIVSDIKRAQIRWGYYRCIPAPHDRDGNSLDPEGYTWHVHDSKKGPGAFHACYVDTFLR